jgi:polar amino acid transport system permease protein
MRGREIISETFLAFEIWFTIAAIYLVVTVSLSIVAGRMERRFGEIG